MSTSEIVYVIPPVLSEAQYRRLTACLYQQAQTMQRQRINAWLNEDFGSEQVRLVINYMARIEYPMLCESDYFGKAKSLLYWFWRRNRARNIGRVFGKVPVFLEDLLADTWMADTWMEDLRFGDPADFAQHQCLTEALPDALQDLGLPSYMAWVWIWREVERESWSDVAELLSVRFGIDEKVTNLRQWKVRYFDDPRLLRALRARLDGEAAERIFFIREKHNGPDTPPDVPHKSCVSKTSARRTGGRSFFVCFRECHKGRSFWA